MEEDPLASGTGAREGEGKKAALLPLILLFRERGKRDEGGDVRTALREDEQGGGEGRKKSDQPFPNLHLSFFTVGKRKKRKNSLACLQKITVRRGKERRKKRGSAFVANASYISYSRVEKRREREGTECRPTDQGVERKECPVSFLFLFLEGRKKRKRYTGSKQAVRRRTDLASALLSFIHLRKRGEKGGEKEKERSASSTKGTSSTPEGKGEKKRKKRSHDNYFLSVKKGKR